MSSGSRCPPESRTVRLPSRSLPSLTLSFQQNLTIVGILRSIKNITRGPTQETWGPGSCWGGLGPCHKRARGARGLVGDPSEALPLPLLPLARQGLLTPLANSGHAREQVTKRVSPPGRPQECTHQHNCPRQEGPPEASVVCSSTGLTRAAWVRGESLAREGPCVEVRVLLT